MRPLTWRKIYNQGHTINMHLGDVFIVKDSFKASNTMNLDGLLPLAIMVTSFSNDGVHFVMIGLDIINGHIDKHDKNDIVLTNGKGKSITMTDEELVNTFGKFEPNKLHLRIGGVILYLRPLTMKEEYLKRTQLRKTGKRVINICDWPYLAIRTWAHIQLGIPEEYRADVYNNAHIQENINALLKEEISRYKANTANPDEPPESKIAVPKSPIEEVTGALSRGEMSLSEATKAFEEYAAAEATSDRSRGRSDDRYGYYIGQREAHGDTSIVYDDMINCTERTLKAPYIYSGENE